MSIVAALLLISSASASTSQPSLQCVQLPQLFEAYFSAHYSIHEMNDDVRNRTIDQYIKQTDPSKTLLLQADVDASKKALMPMFKTMQTGNCSALSEVLKIAIERSEEDEKFVKTVLGKDYKLDESIELQTDPDKRGFPKTKEEKNALLMKMIHFQISNYLLADTKLPEAKKQLIHRYELATKRLKEKGAKEGVGNLAVAFASALDPHSSYLSPDNLEDFQISMRLSLEGIGASLSTSDGFTVIEDLIPGGGAEKSGLLKPKDKIVSVAQDGKKAESVIDWDLKDVVKKIRGPKGTKVTLTILRQAERTETFEVTIVRAKIDVKDQAAKVNYEKRKVGDKDVKIAVIELPSFYGGDREQGGRSCYNDMRQLIKEARKEKVDGIVLNLSRNGGGLLEDAVRISGLFIDKGGVVATKDSQKKVQVLADEDSEVQWNGPLVVMVSRLSASASEILAGALKDYRRAVVVGSDHTFGKGTVQILSGLGQQGSFGAMKVTTGMFFLPGGDSTQHKGVASDILVPSSFGSAEDVGEKVLDYSLPPQSTASFLGKEANSNEPVKHWTEVQPALVKKLADKSQSRIAKDAKFIEIRKELEETAKNKGIIRLAEMRKKADKKKPAKGKAEREQKIKDIEAPFIAEGVNILADMIVEGRGELVKN